MILTLHEAEARLRQYVAGGDVTAAVQLFYQVVYDRTGAMHLRAQEAESRAHKAERNLERIAQGV